jgi:hypothetical protein
MSFLAPGHIPADHNLNCNREAANYLPLVRIKCQCDLSWPVLLQIVLAGQQCTAMGCLLQVRL